MRTAKKLPKFHQRRESVGQITLIQSVAALLALFAALVVWFAK